MIEQPEMKNTATEIKTRRNQQWTVIQRYGPVRWVMEHQKSRRLTENKNEKRNKHSLTDIWHKITDDTQICITGGPRRLRERGPKDHLAEVGTQGWIHIFQRKL